MRAYPVFSLACFSFPARPSPRRGFTLIEILLAMTILLIGIVGVLALFPVALRNSKASFEDSVAAMVAENIHASLVASLRRAPVCQRGILLTDDPTRYFFFYAEGAASALTNPPVAPPVPTISDFTDAEWTSYMAIPLTGNGRFFYPPTAQPANLDDFATTTPQAVSLGNSWTAATLNNLATAVGGTDPYRQYSFQLFFDPTTDPKERLLQVTIRIFRNFTGAAGELPVHEFVCQVAYN